MILVAVFASLISPALASPTAFDYLSLHPLAPIKTVESSAILTLEDGSNVKLQGIDIPNPALTKSFLQKYKGKKVDLWSGPYTKDRHGRYQGIVAIRAGDILQETLLREGLARVYLYAGADTLGKAEDYLQDLKKIEAEARQNKKGIWNDSIYAVKTPVETTKLIGTYQIVRGKIVSAKKVNNRAFLNFGADWKTDFTVVLESRALGKFAKSIKSLEGKTITARGFIADLNGPNITATTPLQIDVELGL